MSHAFDVRVTEFAEFREVPGVWSPERFEALLEDLDYGGTSGIDPNELREMCLLSLSMLPPDEAAEVVLRHQFGSRLRDGQIRNHSHEMLDEKLWEEHADMDLHEDFFHAGSLLFAAHPDDFPTPDAVRIRLRVEACTRAAREQLAEGVHESWVIRLMADGMDEHCVLHRLFEDELAGKRFSSPADVIWIMEAIPIDEQSMWIDVVSSGYWLDPLREAHPFESSAKPDRAAKVA